MSRSILVVAAHPDDEVLGCGGTMVRHITNGDKVHVLIMAEGLTSRDNIREREKWAADLSELSRAAHEANEYLGVIELTLYDFPDNRMDNVDLLDIVKVVEAAVDKYQPEIVYTHHSGDVNIDHEIVNRAVITACRPVPGCPVKTILFFEVPSSTEWQAKGNQSSFIPNWFVDVGVSLDMKLKALEIYHCEMRPWPHTRSLQAVEHLARWRGSTVGVDAAEAFVLGRMLTHL